MSYGHGPKLGAGGAEPGAVPACSETGAARRAALEREVDPDGALPPEEVARLVDERLSGIARRAVATNRARKAAAGLVDPAAAEGATRGHPPEPEPLSRARRPEVADVVPGLLAHAEVLTVLADRDIGALYRTLQGAGISQRQIAESTGQRQSEMVEIINGRQVHDVFLLERIADGLGIERGLMRLAGTCGPDAYSGDVTDTPAPDEVDDEMLRRHLIALGPVAMVGTQVKGIGELSELPKLPAAPLPSRLEMVHVVQVRDLAHQLREGLRTYGSNPELSSTATTAAMRLLDVPGSKTVRRALLTALAELHLHAGWAAFDAGLYRRSMWHYAHAFERAVESGDAYCQSLALNRAGLATLEHGHPNDALKMLQAGQVKAWGIPAQLGRPVVIGEGSQAAVEARSRADAAAALAALGQHQAAEREQGTARQLWTPAPGDPAGDLDIVAAQLQLDLGHLDAAEPLAAASVRRWERVSRRARTQSGIVLATIHVRAGEPRGMRLAHDAITDSARLSSVRARQRLLPLAEALESRPGGDAKELARQARRVAA